MRHPASSELRFSRAGRRQRGVMLALVLWMILILTVFAYSLTYELRVGMTMTSMNVRKLRARALARAGMAQAVVDLRNDRLMTIAQQPGSNDTLSEIWARDDDKSEVKRGEGSFSVRVSDEESKFDLNTLQQTRLPLLKEVLKTAGHYHDDEAQEIAAAINDFIDPDLMTSGRTQGNEVEVLTQWGLDHYAKMLPAGWIFRPKNDALQTLDELMAVPGIDVMMLHGDPEKEPDDPLARIDFLRGEVGTVRPSISLDDCLSVGTAGNLNINTASPAVLRILMQAANPGAEVDSWVQKVVQARKNKQPSSPGVTGITDIGQLAQLGIPADFIQRMVALYPLAVASTNFKIAARGDYQGVHHTVVATVSIRMEPFPIDPEKHASLGTRDPAAEGSLRSQTTNKIDPAVRVTKLEER